MPNFCVWLWVGTIPLRSARGRLAGTLLRGEKGQFFLRPMRAERAANRLGRVFTGQPSIRLITVPADWPWISTPCLSSLSLRF